MKTESMVVKTKLEELKGLEFEKKMTEDEMASIKGGKEKDKDEDLFTIHDDEVPL